VSKIEVDSASSEDEMDSGIITPPKLEDSIIKNQNDINAELEAHLNRLKLMGNSAPKIAEEHNIMKQSIQSMNEPAEKDKSLI